MELFARGKGQLISEGLFGVIVSKSRSFSKKTNEGRLTLLRNNSSSQKKEIRPFVFLENLRLGNLLSKLTDL